ncbi:MAG: citrate lyase holo-[Bacteroidales bacterium]|nr:citrate lyase holo-[acyl-carrier protein] synthase [Bacteroidales bacterium]
MEITLTELLASRDARVEHQKKLAREFPRASLICFTVILPGSVKRDDRSLTVAKAGVHAIRQTFQTCHSERSEESLILYQEERDLVTGFEAYFVVDLPAVDVKRICCEIEDNHPLGRLMDIDVIAGPEIRPLSRAESGLPERRCLLCEKPARECMRAHRHTQAELHAAIDTLIKYAGKPE